MRQHAMVMVGGGDKGGNVCGRPNSCPCNNWKPFSMRRPQAHNALYNTTQSPPQQHGQGSSVSRWGYKTVVVRFPLLAGKKKKKKGQGRRTENRGAPPTWAPPQLPNAERSAPAAPPSKMHISKGTRVFWPTAACQMPPKARACGQGNVKCVT
jgi:hypothetical protein